MHLIILNSSSQFCLISKTSKAFLFPSQRT
nr:MAG TPA: hypothetical protein [Caudoviricetes sp.]